jgi:hypothetical protein
MVWQDGLAICMVYQHGLTIWFIYSFIVLKCAKWDVHIASIIYNPSTPEMGHEEMQQGKRCFLFARYPLVNCPITMENHYFWMRKSTMAIFNSYVSWPEGIQRIMILWLWHNIYVSGGKIRLEIQYCKSNWIIMGKATEVQWFDLRKTNSRNYSFLPSNFCK